MGRSQNELLILSFSGGTESGAIFILALFNEQFRKQFFNYNRVIVIFADTLNEFPYTYDFIRQVRDELLPAGWEFVWLDPSDGYNSTSWSKGLIGHYEKYDNIGSKYYPKSCTLGLKFSPIYKWLERNLIEFYGYRDRGRKRAFYDFLADFGKVDVIIGLHDGEQRRITKPEKMDKWFHDTVNVIYPLIEIGYDRPRSQEVFTEYGFPLVMPSNCMICPFSSHFDVLHLYREYPDMYERWVELEANKLNKHQALGEMNKTVFGEIPLPMVLEEAKEKYNGVSKQELITLKASHGCVASTW